MNLKKYHPYGTVKFCRNNVCIEARGENGRILVLAVCIALILAGVAALANAVK